MLMKKIFTLMAAMLVCVSGVMAAVGGKLRIPAMEHISAVVTRGSETLADGDSVWSGDVLHILYTPEAHYCIARTNEYSREKTVTLKDNDFCQDWTNLIDGASQGFTQCTADGSNFEGVGVVGWMRRMPGFNGGATTVSEKQYLSFTPTVSGTLKISFVRGLNQDIIRWGKFKMYWQKNGVNQTSALLDFTSTANITSYNLLYDTITVTVNGSTDQITWVCEKTANDWGDDGRMWYVGSIHLLGGGDYYIESLNAEEMYEVLFEPGEHVNVTASLDEDGRAIAHGDYAPWSKHLTYIFRPDADYVFTDGSGFEQVTVQLNESCPGYNSSEKNFVFTCHKTATRDASEKFALAINLAEHVSLDAIQLNDANYNLGDSVKAGDVLYCQFKTDDGWIFSDNTTTKESTVTIAATMADADKRITINSPAAQEIIHYTLVFDIPEHASLKSVKINGANWDGGTVVAGDVVDYEFVAEKHYKFEEWDDDYIYGSRTLYANMANENNEIIISCPATIFVPGIKFQFVASTHNSLKYAKLNGVDYDGGYAWNGDTIDFAFVADKGYDFFEITHEEGILELGAKMPVDESMADADGIVKFECPPASLRPEFVVIVPEVPHTTYTLKVNSQPIESGDNVYPGDTLQYRFETEHGYEFKYTGDTIYEDYDIIYRGITSNDTIFFDCQPVIMSAPELTIEVLDATTAKLSWTGICTESKLLITEEYPEDDPDYLKGFLRLNEKEYVAENLKPNTSYYVFLQGSEPDLSRMVHQTFVTFDDGGNTEESVLLEPSASCLFTIEMQDVYGDGWNGNTFIIQEGSNRTPITLYDGYSGTTTYESLGDSVQILWSCGSYAEEVSFSIKNEDGDEILAVEPGDADYFESGQELAHGYLCLVCESYIDNLRLVEKDNLTYTVAWDPVNASSFDIAISPKSGANSTYLNSIAVHLTDTFYTFTGSPYKGYEVCVRTKCNENKQGSWKRLIVTDGLPAGDLENAVRKYAKSITLDYIENGNLLENALTGEGAGDLFPILAYKLDAEEDTTKVLTYFSAAQFELGMLYILQDTAANARMKMVALYDLGGSKLDGDTISVPSGCYIVFLSHIDSDNALGDYTLRLLKPELPIKAIEPDYTEKVSLKDAVYREEYISTSYNSYSGPVLRKTYSYTPTDTALVVFSLISDTIINTGMMYMTPPVLYLVYRDTIDNSHRLSSGVLDQEAWSDIAEKGHTYYFAVYGLIDAGATSDMDFNLTLAKIRPLEAKPITPDYTETGDFSDAVEWINPLTGTLTYAKAYSFTPSDTMEVVVNVESNAAMYSTGAFFFLNSFDHLLMDQTAPFTKSFPLLKDSTYLMVVGSMPVLQGTQDDIYTFNLLNAERFTQPTITPIQADTIVYGQLTIDDFVGGDINAKVKIFEWTIDTTTHAALGIFFDTTRIHIPESMPFIPSSPYTVVIYKDTMDIESRPYSYADGMMSYTPMTFEAKEKGTRYYFVVVAESDWMTSIFDHFYFHFRPEINYDDPQPKATVEVGKRYDSNLSNFDPFTYHMWPGPAEVYQFEAEKDKKYVVLMHIKNENAPSLSAAVLDPTRKSGSYSGNLLTSYNGCEAGWTYANFTPTKTGTYMLMFDAALSTNYLADTLDYEFAVLEYEMFMDAIGKAQLVMAPYEESGTYRTEDTKVFWSGEYSFNTPHSALTNFAGAFNTKVYAVPVPANDTLFVEYGGDVDMILRIYDFTDASTGHSPRIADEYDYGFPNEVAYYVNTAQTAHIVYVVAACYEVDLTDVNWSIRFGLGQKAVDNRIAKPVADQEKVYIYNDQGEMDAVAALSALNLSAVDATTGATVGSIANYSSYWIVDMANLTARYEVNDRDLPMGYVLSRPTEWIDVNIEVLPYSQGIDDLEGEQRVEIRKFLYNGHIYIQTPQGIFNITGQRVR